MKIFAAAIALVALSVSPPAAAQSGNAQYCIQTAAGARCLFDTMADCERARGNSSTQCMTRTDARGTTGLGEPTGRRSSFPTEPPPPAPTER